MDLARGDGDHLGRHLRTAVGVDDAVDEEEGEAEDDAGSTCGGITASGEAAG